MEKEVLKDKKYLPIGTVVVLKNATKRIMITGFASMSPETGDLIFDYSGCAYPEGFLNYNEVCVFNHEQIDKVFFKGFVDDEEREFKKALVEQLEQISVPKDEPTEEK
jgi:hypothetical protein